jgi:hypothetical protein
MTRLHFGRYAFSIGAAVLLTGCSWQSGGPGTMPEGITTSDHAALGGSWMLPEAKRGDLLYVGSPVTDDVYVYTYPGGKLVGTLTGLDNPQGLCSDTKGNVWTTNADSHGNSYLAEYAHGGTTAIATLDDSGFLSLACSVDPTTGDLAVGQSIDDVAVWRNGRGKPRHYLTSCCVFASSTITYDGSGNAIFADFRTRSGWLPNGHSKVMKFGLQPHLRRHGVFDWDGKYLGVLVFSRKLRQEEVIQYKVSGGMARQVGTVPLSGVAGVNGDGQFVVQDSGMVLTDSRTGSVYFYNYPAGGNPTHTLSGLDDPYGVTVSIAPSGWHIRK